MKKIIYTLAAFLPLLVFSQKDFEGIITYKGFKNSSDSSFEAKFYFSNGKVKVRIFNSKTDDPDDKESNIYDFLGGEQYSINEERKSYSVHSLDMPSFDDSRFVFKDTSLGENILGHLCRAYIIKPEEELFMSAFSGISWYADSLRFTIPSKYRGRNSFESLPDGNMLFLKSVVYVGSDEDKNEIDSFYVVAQKIERMTLNQSEFLPPADYTKITIEEMEEATYPDSALVDSSGLKELILEDIKKEEPKKPPAKSSKPSKSPAKKEKETKPVKG